MNQTYYTIITKQGAALLANATALGVPLKITQMAVGDGNGKIPKPDANQTKLVHEVRRAAINTLFVDKENPNQIIAEQVIPESDGGWFIHEIGLFDDKGNLIAVGNCPATYKPKLVEGSGRTQVIRMVIIVDNAQSIELKIDPAVVLATREYVDDLITATMTAHEKSTNHPNATTKSKGFVQLNSAIDSNLENQAATPLAIKKTYDLALNANNIANNAVQRGQEFPYHGYLGDKHLNYLGATSFGIYYQNSNEKALIERSYPVSDAGSLSVLKTEGDGNEGCVQIYTLYKNGRQFIRNYRGSATNGFWEEWVEQITTKNIANYFPAKSWQNLTSQRALNITYTNTGKWPIFLAVGLTHGWSGTVATMTLTINGVDFVSSAGGAGNGSTKTVAMYMPIPAGNSFSVTGNAPLFFWYELR